MKSTHNDSDYNQARRAIETLHIEFEAVRGDYAPDDAPAKAREAITVQCMANAKSAMGDGEYTEAKAWADKGLQVLGGN